MYMKEEFEAWLELMAKPPEEELKEKQETLKKDKNKMI